MLDKPSSRSRIAQLSGQPPSYTPDHPTIESTFRAAKKCATINVAFDVTKLESTVHTTTSTAIRSTKNCATNWAAISSTNQPTNHPAIQPTRHRINIQPSLRSNQQGSHPPKHRIESTVSATKHAAVRAASQSARHQVNQGLRNLLRVLQCHTGEQAGRSTRPYIHRVCTTASLHHCITVSLSSHRDNQGGNGVNHRHVMGERSDPRE